MQRLGIAALLVLLLAACAPSADGPRVTVAQLTEPVGYYPQQTGATWQYLPSNALLDEARVFQRVEGPTVLDGQVWIAWRLVGRGLDVISYRQYRPDGVFLRRELRPGTEIDFDPPIREYPSEGSLRVGATWSGQTTASVVYPEARPENRSASLTLDYTYTVVDQRRVSIASGDFEVFVINFTSRTTDEFATVLEEFTQELWFAPFVGEVRTEQGFFLVESNVLAETPEEPR